VFESNVSHCPLVVDEHLQFCPCVKRNMFATFRPVIETVCWEASVEDRSTECRVNPCQLFDLKLTAPDVVCQGLWVSAERSALARLGLLRYAKKRRTQAVSHTCSPVSSSHLDSSRTCDENVNLGFLRNAKKRRT